MRRHAKDLEHRCRIRRVQPEQELIGVAEALAVWVRARLRLQAVGAVEILQLPGLERRKYGDQIIRHNRTGADSVTGGQRDGVGAGGITVRKDRATGGVGGRVVAQIP